MTAPHPVADSRLGARARWRAQLRRGVATVALVAAAWTLAPKPTALADTVGLRAHAHADFGRMVFDWANPVEYDARVEGTRLLVTFKRTIDTPVSTAVGALSAYVSGGRVEGDGRTVAFDLKRPVTLRSFTSGPKVAVDLRFTADAAFPAGTAANAATKPPATPPATATAATPPAKAPGPAATAPPALPPPSDQPNTATIPADTPAPKLVASPPGLRVPVRAADHPQHSRVVFDWPMSTDYAIRRDGQAVTLLFNRDAAATPPRADLRNVSRMETYRQADGGLAVTFAAPVTSDIKDFRNGNSVVLDVGNPGTRVIPKPEMAAAGDKPGTDAPKAASPTVPSPAGTAPVAPAPPPGATTTVVRDGTPGSAPIPPATGTGAAAPPAPPSATAPATPPATAPAPPKTAGAAEPTPTARMSSPTPVVAGPNLVFDAGGPASMAAFARGGYFYVVFDRTLPLGAGVITGGNKEAVGQIEPVPATGGSAFRTRVGPFLWPKISRDGTVWTVSPSTQLTTAPPTELAVLPQPDFLLGARLLVRAADAGSAVQFVDPEVGDRLQVVPLPAPSEAVTRPHRYPDLEIIPSFHGVLVKPFTDTVTVRPVREGVEISAAGGLHLSPATDTGGPQALAALEAREKRAPDQPATVAGFRTAEPVPLFEPLSGPRGKRLFDFTAWQLGGPEQFTQSRQQLQLAVAEAPEDARPRAVLDLARFYLSHGLGLEALGLLGVLAESQPDLEAWPEYLALRGVGRYLAGDYAGATDDLMTPGLADNTEAGLWRAAAAAGRRDYSVAAAGFDAAAPILATYPDPLQTDLALTAAEAAFNAGHVDTAQALLDKVVARGGTEVESIPLVQYLRGEVARLRDDPELSRELLTAAYDSLDRLVRAKAGLALTELELADKSISPEGAVERLAGLTYIWRGDELEMDIRQRLGEILVESGQFADGFNSLRETAAMRPDSPRARHIAEFMQKTFANLYKDGASALPVLEAMKLYDQFRELTPVGVEGDHIIRELAERLANIDLLARASDLYEHQVRYRLGGIEKAKVGTRLASLRLLDNKPDEAIKALEMSNVAGLPKDLEDERRTMYAKALTELGREAEALQLLAEDDSTPADLLRVDIAWRSQKWEAAAIALSKVIGQPPNDGKPLNADRSQLVLNRAVALALAGDGTGLNTLRKEFGRSMAEGPDADAFRVLTRPEQATGLIDIDTIRARVAEVDVFQNFLKGYRSRMEQEKAPANTPPASTPMVN